MRSCGPAVIGMWVTGTGLVAALWRWHVSASQGRETEWELVQRITSQIPLCSSPSSSVPGRGGRISPSIPELRKVTLRVIDRLPDTLRH